MKIDLTPTKDEYARIIAYVLASHLDGNPNRFGDYWNMTDDEQNSLFLAYERIDAIDKALEVVGMSLYKLPKATKKKVILEALRSANPYGK